MIPKLAPSADARIMARVEVVEATVVIEVIDKTRITGKARTDEQNATKYFRL
jgi:hypothetical protein